MAHALTNGLVGGNLASSEDMTGALSLSLSLFVRTLKISVHFLLIVCYFLVVFS